jgi:glycosyltransferase involved in cell wall biosynthesis
MQEHCGQFFKKMIVNNLALFFTRNVSLQTWFRNGSLEREIALYLRLHEKGVEVSFVTYGDKKDRELAKELHGIRILCNNWNLSQNFYARLIPYLHARSLRYVDVIKTNQTDGAEIALRAAKLWQKPLIARCGYMWSVFASNRGRHDETKQARQIEQRVFSYAQRVIVTTSSMKEYAVKQYGIPLEQIQVIPNYVLTDVFSPNQRKPQLNTICFIGRLNEQKNLPALINACAGLEVELTLIGEGNLRKSLQEQARQLGVRVNMPGNLPHNQLPDMIRQSSIFALVSNYEGHPKSLLEAMSCGAAVLAANSPGIREQIRHNETGILCETDPQSIRSGLQYLLSEPTVREKLGKNAHRFIEENYSLERIVEMEYSLLNNLLTGVS